MSNLPNRRNFIGGAASAVAAATASRAILVNRFAGAAELPDKKPKLCVFTKPFNSLSFDELADRIAELGFDGIEAPVRRGGHVEPDAVADRLPELHEALAKRGLEISILTTDINDPADPLTERLLRTAATLGIRKYRMKYFRYDLSRRVEEQIPAWRDQMRDLGALNHDFGVQGLYQNHAGIDYFGAAIWDLHLGLVGIPKEQIGIAYDLRHGMVEAGMSWPVGLNLVRDQIAALYFKDFLWEGDRAVDVPLGQGRVRQDAVKRLGLDTFEGPISLHEEYLDHADPKLVPQHLEAMKRDLATLKKWI